MGTTTERESEILSFRCLCDHHIRGRSFKRVKSILMIVIRDIRLLILIVGSDYIIIHGHELMAFVFSFAFINGLVKEIFPWFLKIQLIWIV
jgi:hypothetical protein